MKIEFNSLWSKMSRPSLKMKIAVLIVTFISVAGSILMLFVDYDESALAVVAYSLFGIAGISFSYSVYLIVLLFPKTKKKVIIRLQKYEFTDLLLNNFGFRTVIFSIGSFVMSVLFGGFNVYMCIINRSV